MDRDVGGAGDATEGKTTMAMTATTPTLPLVFERFLEAEGVSRSTYDAYYGPSQSGSDSRVAVDGDDGHSNSGQGRPTVPQRYFTINTIASDKTIVNTTTESDTFLPTTATRVPFCPRFFMVDGGTRMAQYVAVRSGRAICMDVSSALAVFALGVERDDHVLDLCCAPGVKLALINVLLHGNGGRLLHEGGGTATGVDISRHRLSTCRALARKYHLYRTRLFLDDGATFDVGAPACAKDIVAHRRSAKGKLKATASACDTRTCTSTTTLMKRPFHVPKFLSDLPVELSAGLYDKILVDAECTHDGSIVHLLHKHDSTSETTAHKSFSTANYARHIHPERVRAIRQLQLRLLMNAWRLLKPGGVLVYSTCSFTRGQNEDVVAAFLLGERGKDADVEWIEDTADARFSVLRRQCDEDDDDHRSEDDTTSERLDPELVATYGEDVVAPIYACIAKNRLRVHGYYHVDGDSDGDNDDPQLDANRFWMSGLFIVKLRKKQPVFLECDSR